MTEDLLDVPAPAGAPPQQHGWLRLPPGRTGLDTSKSPLVLAAYEELLAPLREAGEFCMLELGVLKGDSLLMFSEAFPQATIVGVDIDPPEGLEVSERVHIVKGDQSDARLLASLRAQYAPDGFDVVVDDASHYGVLTAKSLQAIYPYHLKPGGLYMIEDWGTGYWSDWEDGGAPATPVGVESLADESTPGAEAPTAPVRLASHDAGMVGLVKRLIDHAGARDIESHEPTAITDSLAIDWIRVQHGLVVVKKPEQRTPSVQELQVTLAKRDAELAALRTEYRQLRARSEALQREHEALQREHEALVAEVEHLRRVTANVPWLLERNETLEQIYHGGWWKLRSRVAPLLKLAGRGDARGAGRRESGAAGRDEQHG